MTVSDWLCLSSVVAWLTVSTLVPMRAVTDAARLPNAAWAKSGRDKRLWVVLPVLATALCGIGGLIASWAYYRDIRPLVVAHRSSRAASETRDAR